MITIDPVSGAIGIFACVCFIILAGILLHYSTDEENERPRKKRSAKRK